MHVDVHIDCIGTMLVFYGDLMIHHCPFLKYPMILIDFVYMILASNSVGDRLWI